MKKNIWDLLNFKFTMEEEAFAFELFGGKRALNFIKTPKRERKVEDYGRLLTISMVFGFRRVFLRLLGDGDSRTDEIINYLNTEGKKLKVVDAWINEAIDNVPDEKLKISSRQLWREIKEDYGGDFDVVNLLDLWH